MTTLKQHWQEALSFYRDYELEALKAMENFAQARNFPGLEQKLAWAAEIIHVGARQLAQWAAERAELAAEPEKMAEALPAEAAGRVWARVNPAPSHLGGELARLPAEESLEANKFLKQSKAGYSYPIFLEYWTDGKRTLAETLEMVRLETGAWHAEFAVQYFELCQRLGIVRRVK